MRFITCSLEIFEVAGVSGQELRLAIASQATDYEDAVLIEAARSAKAEAIVTRDAKGFRKTPLPVYHPESLLALLEESGKS